MRKNSTNFIGDEDTRYRLVLTDRDFFGSAEVVYLSKQEHALTRAFVMELLRSDPAKPMAKMPKREHCGELLDDSGCCKYNMTKWLDHDFTGGDYSIPLSEQEFFFVRRLLTLLHGPNYQNGVEENDIQSGLPPAA